MSAVQLRVSEQSDKQTAVPRPEVDDDAWTESSEGSTGHWNAIDSDDEFVDAVEPPLSTGLDIAAPPLSGVYEDAVEATVEQVLEAMETTLSEGRQSTILDEVEGMEAATEQKEEQASEVIEEVETAAVKDEPEDTPNVGIVAGGAVAGEAAEATVDSEDVATEAVKEAEDAATRQDDQVAAEESESETLEASEEPADVKNDPPVGSADVVAEDDKTDATHEAKEAAEAPESSADTEESAAEPAVETAPVDTADMDEATASGSAREEPTDEQVASSAESATEDVVDPADEASATETEIPVNPSAPIDLVVDEVLATVLREIVAAETNTLESADEKAGANDTEQLTTEEETATIVAETVETIVDEVCAHVAAVHKAVVAESPPEDTGVVENTPGTDEETSEDGTAVGDDAAAEAAALHDGEDTSGSHASAAWSEPEADLSAGVVREVLSACVAEVERATAETEGNAAERPSSPGSNGAHDVVHDVLQELTAAVEAASQDADTSELKPVVEDQSADTTTADEVPTPETAPKEVAIRSVKPSDDVTADVSTTSSTQMAVTTSTTSLTSPPATHSTDDSDATPAPAPVQRWTYQIFGFTIENRVVLYHIHKTDRRTGIRERPILKRYSDFRELEDKLLASSSLHAAKLPRLPKPSVGTFIRGRKSKKTIEIREKAFRSMLTHIAMYPDLHGSAIFERFLEKNRDTHTGWM